MPLTARDMARRIARREEDEQPVFERIRHWTRDGLLTVEGELNPGTGRERHYPVFELGKARAFNELANMGISPKVMKSVARLLTPMIVGDNIYEQLLVIYVADDNKPDVSIVGAARINGKLYAPVSDDHASTFVLNLTTMFGV